MKANQWLENKEFLERVDFFNLEYFTSLCSYVASYLRSVPIPVLSTWDPVHKNIYFIVGKDKRYFKVDVDLSYWDYITLVNRWLSKYFPSYEVKYEKEISLTEDEIINRIKANPKNNLNDLLLVKEKALVKEKGVIYKIKITEDKFFINIDGQEFLRMSGTFENPMSLTIFLKLLKEIKDGQERKDFIFTNSEELKSLSTSRKEVLVQYTGKMMLNFFVTQFNDLKKEEITQYPDGSFCWGKFRIIFNSSLTKEECFSYLAKRYEQEGITNKIISN
jgi:hypothetical protein